MARRASAGFGILRYEPGNPEFPTLPDGVKVPHFVELDRVAGFRAHTITTRRRYANAPANDSQRFAGWQTDTTWVNPTIIDFGTIPSPIQRTVSLYNARFEPVTVTALTLPTGVVLVDGGPFPVTLEPYAGITFTLEAGTTGDDSFDEFHEFTTSEGQVPVRLIGRRVFTLAVTPETPMFETLLWRTDILRSTDGTEKAYSLMRSPNSMVDYKLKFTDDYQRINFRNQYLAGSSQLVVAAEKWYEKRSLKFPVDAADTTVDVDMYPINASFQIGDSFTIVSPDGVATNTLVEDISIEPDALAENVQLMINFDGPDGATTATDESQNASVVTFVGALTQIDDAQSPFGGSSSLLVNNSNGAVEVPYNSSWMDWGASDFTIEFWIRPAPNDLLGGGLVPVPLARYYTLDGAPGTYPWYIDIQAGSIRMIIASVATATFNFGSPRELQANTWHHVCFERVGPNLTCYIDGVQLSSVVNIGVSAFVNGTSRITIGGYYNSGFFSPLDGHMADVRFTIGTARYGEEFTPPTARFQNPTELYTRFTLSTALGVDKPLGSYVMPLGLGYTARFPKYSTYRDNLEEVDYTIMMNREPDLAELPATIQTLSDGLSPETLIPILERCNVIEGRAKVSKLDREEYILDSGLTNRAAFNKFNYGSISSTYKIHLTSPDEVWEWRTFLHWLAGSYRVFYVPTFKNDIPGVTTLAGNTFTANTTKLNQLFGTPPDNPRLAIRLLYPDGTLQYRRITQIVDNGATEDFTLSSVIDAGSPTISFLQECRILGDTATFKHITDTDVELIFSYRTILK
jgi:hypothetical protein